MKKGGFVFDLDGLLVDSEPLWGVASKEIMQSFCIELNLKNQIRTTGINIENCARYMCKKIRFKINETEMKDRLINKMLNLIDSGIKKMRGADRIIQLTSESRQAIASSSPKKIIYKILTRNNWCNHFDLIISGEDVKKGKPEPDIFIKVSEELKISPENLIVFEDSSNGILSAYYAKKK